MISPPESDRATTPFAPATRAGFTLVEVVVAAVILSVLAAVTIPSVMDAIDKKRVQDSADILLEVQQAITNTAGTGFLAFVRAGASTTNTSMMPGSVSHLSEPILSNNSTNYPNSCGANAGVTSTFGAYGNAGVTAQTTWTLGGPFLRRVVSTTNGLALPIGQLQNKIWRTINSVTTPPWGGTLGGVGSTVAQWIRLRVQDVDPKDQTAIDSLMDGVSGTNVGRIRYDPTPGTTIEFLIPVPNRC